MKTKQSRQGKRATTTTGRRSASSTKARRKLLNRDEPQGVLAGPKNKTAAAKVLAKIRAQTKANIAAVKKESAKEYAI